MFKRLHAFHCGTETLPEILFDPHTKDVDAVRAMPYLFYLIEHSRGLVAFDTGPNEAFVRDNVAYLGPAASHWKVAFKQGDGARAQLASIGIDIDDVSTVLMSHLHYDHAGAMRAFRNAEFLVQKREWEFAREPPPSQINNYVRSEFDVPPGSLRLIDGRFDVFDDESLVLVPTPGHTPGHQSLLIKGAGARYLLAADAAYLSNLDDDGCLPGDAFAWSSTEMARSRDILRALRDQTGATTMCTHDPAFASGLPIASFDAHNAHGCMGPRQPRPPMNLSGGEQ